MRTRPCLWPWPWPCTCEPVIAPGAEQNVHSRCRCHYRHRYIPPAYAPGYFAFPHVIDAPLLTNLSSRFNVISAATVEDGHPAPEGVTMIGRQTREGYEALVGRVRVMLGVGHPPISPSVWTAL